MKKIGLGFLVLAALMMIPVCAFALQPISDSQMASITAQSGVSIAVDDVLMYNHFDNISYTDNDGLVTGTPLAPVVDPNGAGTVSLSNISMTTYINAITSYNAATATSTNPGLVSPGTVLQGDYTGLASGVASAFMPQALTIDVGTLPVLSAGYSYAYNVLSSGATTTADVVGVNIGLPTLEIYVPSFTFTPTVTSANTTGAVINNGADYGTIALSGMTCAILGGHLEIAPH